jgi:hypothetical protein
MKKFEEGVFSDLRNLKPGTDAILEEPKVGFLPYSMMYVRVGRSRCRAEISGRADDVMASRDGKAMLTVLSISHRS